VHLTDAAILHAEPAAKPVKLTDGGGLYLLLTPTGRRWWRFDYRYAGKRKTLACGVYPAVPVEEARARRDECRELLRAGIDPSDQNRAERAERLRMEGERDKPVRFSLASDGALSVRLGRRCFALSPSETADLRAFLIATAGVSAKE
jgi:hypothetical protein